MPWPESLMLPQPGRRVTLLHSNRVNCAGWVGAHR
jgi:hypothetical protein